MDEPVLNAVQEATLAAMWKCWPMPQERRSTHLNLTTIKALERKGLAAHRTFYDNTLWPPRPTRESDRTWEAQLTPAGVQYALRRGLPHHEAYECRLVAVGGCAVHQEKDPIPLPVLDAGEEQ